MELAHAGEAPEGGVLGVERQAAFGARHAFQARLVQGAKRGQAHRTEHAMRLHPGVAEAGVDLGRGKPGGFESGRPLMHHTGGLDEELCPTQPDGVGRSTVVRGPPHLAEPGPGRPRRGVQRPAVGRIVPPQLEHAAKIVDVVHGGARHRSELLRALVGAVLQLALGIGQALGILHQRQHRQQRHHRHHQPPHQAAGRAQGGGTGRSDAAHPFTGPPAARTRSRRCARSSAPRACRGCARSCGAGASRAGRCCGRTRPSRGCAPAP